MIIWLGSLLAGALAAPFISAWRFCAVLFFATLCGLGAVLVHGAPVGHALIWAGAIYVLTQVGYAVGLICCAGLSSKYSDPSSPERGGVEKTLRPAGPSLQPSRKAH